MAGQPVNPQIQPTNPQDYTRESKPVYLDSSIQPQGQQANSIQPQGVTTPDRSGEFAGDVAATQAKQQGVGYQIAGDVIGGAVQAADFGIKASDTLIKKDIERQVYDSANAERELYTNSLEAIKGIPGLSAVLGGTVNGGAGDATPGELEGLGDTLGTMSQANAAGKLSNTQYWGKALSMAKDLRTKYPGYKDYIDNEFSKVLGSNPANAYIQGLVHDINTQGTLASQQQNKIQSYVESKLGEIGAYLPPAIQTKILDMAKSGQFTSVYDVMKITAPYENQKARLTMKASQASADATDFAKNSQDYMGDRLSATASNFVKNIQVELGVDNKVNFMTFLQNASQGKYSTEIIQRVVPYLEQKRFELQQNLWADANSKSGASTLVDPSDGKPKSIVQAVGAPKALENIKAQMDLFDNVINAYKSGNYASVWRAQTMVDARQQDFNKTVADHPKLGPEGMTYKALINNFGQDSQMVKDLFTRFISNGLAGDVDKFFQSHTSQMAGQAKLDDAGNMTLKDVAQIQSLNAQKDKKFADPKIQQEFLSTVVKGIQNNQYSDDEKRGFIAAAFGQGNIGFVNQLQPDGVDADGHQVKGQYYTFRYLTSPATLRSMEQYRRTAPDGQVAWDNYHKYLEQEFSNNLFTRSIGDLNGLIHDRKDINVVWNPLKNHFEAQQTSEHEAFGTSTLGGVQKKLDYLNMGLDSMSEFYKADGQKPEMVGNFLIDKLHQFGVNYTSGVRNLPVELAKEIKAGEDRAKANKEGNETFRQGVESSTRSNFASDSNALLNALPPEITNGASPVTKKPVFNYSDEQLMGVDVQDIPEGMSARDFFTQMKKTREEEMQKQKPRK